MEWTPPNPLMLPTEPEAWPTFEENHAWQKDEITTRLRPGEFRGFGPRTEKRKRRRKKGRR